ncbi:MAG: YraN family protein [Clostridia bacterium]|nr:YraN family protein [Clostridia bacterium]
MNAYHVGFLYELRAARYVRANGGRILARRYRARGGEIDLVARYGDAVAFIEVKARPDAPLGSGVEAVTADKRRRVRSAAGAFVQAKGLQDAPCRFDILEFTRAGIRYLPAAF